MSFLKGSTAVLGALVVSVAYAGEAPASESPTAAATAQAPAPGATTQSASGQTASGKTASGAPAKQTVGKILEGTTNIPHSHALLYKEGWRMVSSSEKALDYARDHGVISSGQAIAQVMADLKAHGGEWGANLEKAGEAGVAAGAAVFNGGTELTKKELKATDRVVIAELDYGSATLRAALPRILKGNIALSERTAEDWEALKALPWYKDLGKDLGNFSELTDKALQDMSPHIKADWGKAFAEARTDFNDAYQKSGTREDSLSALPDLMLGYVKAIYSGVAKPASRSAGQLAAASTRVATEAVFLPVADTLIITGRTVESTGLSLYYATSLGVKLVSPTLEGGLLTCVAALSYASTVPTGAVGYSAGIINEVAVMAATSVAGTSVAAGKAVADTGKYAAQVSYDLAVGTTKVAINTAQTGVVLGYNALTAIPAQLLLTGPDALILVMEGSRLVVKSVRGQVRWSGENGDKGGVPVASLPVGSVVDLDALQKEPGVQVRTVSDDPELAKKVLQKLPEDLREGGRP